MGRCEEVMEKSSALIKTFEQNNKKIDIVIENAGISMRTEFKDFPWKNHIEMTNINFHGPVAHTKAILPHFLKNKSGQFVPVSSLAGKVGPALRSNYAGTKHAVVGFFDALRAEVADDGISVT